MIPLGEFQARFGARPSVVASSPGRVNLIGEHIDYLEGLVLPIAIGRHLTVEAAPTENGVFEIWPALPGFDAPMRFGWEGVFPREVPEERWLNYVLGVLDGYRSLGVEVPPFRAVIHSNLPTGAGLSSSAALETAMALVIETLSGIEEEVIDRALLCQRAEHEYVGVPCGIMDQLAVGAGVAGHALLLDCRDLSFRHIAVPENLAILVTDTGVKHSLADGEYRRRREECAAAMRLLGVGTLRGVPPAEVEAGRALLGEPLFSRARHAVTEMERVRGFADALEASNFAALGKILRNGHDSLRDDYEVSCEELDFLVESAYAFGSERGHVGSRMTGGGFGGSVLSLVRSEEAEPLRAHLVETFAERFGTRPNAFNTSAVDGAKVVAVQ